MSERPMFRVSRSYVGQVRDGEWLSRKNRIWLLIALAAGFFVRVNALGAASLWNDEGTSVALAQTSLSAIVNAAARDIHPPLYYILLSGWIQGAGISEFALRFLSLAAGVLVIALTFRIAREFFDQDVAVIAAVLSALNPFQVYYAQEARMYIWVTLFATLSVWAMVVMLKPPRDPATPLSQRIRRRSIFLAFYILATLAALYTNYYAFTLILFENLAFFAWLVWARRSRRPRLGHPILIWIAAQVVIILLYLPWILFARQSLTSWPGISEPMNLAEMAWRISSAFASGTDALHDIQWLLVGAYLVFFVGGLLPSRDLFKQSVWGIVTCALWAIVPLLAMYLVSLSRPAYNPKFLLLATPGFLILVARGVSVLYPGLFLRERTPEATLNMSLSNRLGRQLLSIGKLFVGALFAAGTVLALQSLSTEPTLQRDDYRSIVNYINAVATERDAVIVNAPGQLDVVRYYYNSPAQLVGLPIGRPLQQEATQRALESLSTRETLFGIFWATDQADPEHLIERSLAVNAYKASDDWHGNVRLAQYANVSTPPLARFPSGANLGNEIVLESYMFPAPSQEIEGFVPIELDWRPLKTPPNTRYKVFAHLVDARGQVASQRDTEPHDGFFPTNQWTRDELISDRLAIPIPPGLVPGDYRVEIGLYRGDTGERLTTDAGVDTVELGMVHVDKKVLPRPAVFLTEATNVDLGDIEWLGYKIETPERGAFGQGDLYPLVLYFRARNKPISDARLTVQLLDQGDNIITSASTLETYPTSQWDKGEIVRDVQSLRIPVKALPGEYRIVLTDGARVVDVTKVRVR